MYGIRRNSFIKLITILIVTVVVIILHGNNSSSSVDSDPNGVKYVVPDGGSEEFRFVLSHDGSERRGSSTASLHPPNKSSLSRHDNNLTDVFISIKTTGKYHRSRVDLLIKTWFTLANNQTYIFSDTDDAVLSRQTNGHLYNTNCKVSHYRQDLCCKMAVEFDVFLESNKKWFCHVDDDTYVNVPALLRVLQFYRHNEDWYLGRPSLATPLKVLLKFSPEKHYSYWFATGGAGYCVSRGLALKIAPYVANGKLTSYCSDIRLPDDCTVGFIISYYMNVSLTVVHGFHSHLESLGAIMTSDLSAQVTLSYSLLSDQPNRVVVPGFNISDDPTRFLSLHCYLFPMAGYDCPLHSSG